MRLALVTAAGQTGAAQTASASRVTHQESSQRCEDDGQLVGWRHHFFFFFFHVFPHRAPTPLCPSLFPSIPPLIPDRPHSPYVFPWVRLGCCKDCCKAFSLALIVERERDNGSQTPPPSRLLPYPRPHLFYPSGPPPLLRHTLQGQLTDAQ